MIVSDKNGMMFNMPERKPVVVFDLDHYTSAISNRNSRIFEFVPKNEFKNTSMLEVGAGIGLPGSAFSKLGCTVTSMDGRPDNIKEGKVRFPDREWIEMDFEKSNLKDALGEKKFDYILCLGLLYHLVNPQKLIKEMSQFGKVVFVSTIVCDSDDPDLHYNVEEAGSQDQHLAGSKGSRFSYAWLEERFKEGFDFQDITPTDPTDWCTWLHEGAYGNNSGDFRKMYILNGIK